MALTSDSLDAHEREIKGLGRHRVVHLCFEGLDGLSLWSVTSFCSQIHFLALLKYITA